MHIDWWTLALQAINVLILVWILARFFYRPVADIIDKRRMAAAKQLADASAARSAIDAENAAIAATRAGFAAEREKLLAETRKLAADEREVAMKKAAEDIAALRAENEALLARNREAMERAMVEHASTLAVDIAQKLLCDLPPGLATAAFLDSLSCRFEAMPPQSRALLVSAAGAGGLEVVTAVPLDETEQARCRKAIEALLGVAAKLEFRSDPRLIAGVEIRSDTIVLENNWRDALSRIRQNIAAHDG